MKIIAFFWHDKKFTHSLNNHNGSLRYPHLPWKWIGLRNDKFWPNLFFLYQNTKSNISHSIFLNLSISSNPYITKKNNDQIYMTFHIYMSIQNI